MGNFKQEAKPTVAFSGHITQSFKTVYCVCPLTIPSALSSPFAKQNNQKGVPVQDYKPKTETSPPPHLQETRKGDSFFLVPIRPQNMK